MLLKLLLKKNTFQPLKMEIEDMSPADLGSLFIMFELIITLIGIRLGINPFDQPAVELIKKRLLKKISYLKNNFHRQ